MEILSTYDTVEKLNDLFNELNNGLQFLDESWKDRRLFEISQYEEDTIKIYPNKFLNAFSDLHGGYDILKYLIEILNNVDFLNSKICFRISCGYRTIEEIDCYKIIIVDGVYQSKEPYINKDISVI